MAAKARIIHTRSDMTGFVFMGAKVGVLYRARYKKIDFEIELNKKKSKHKFEVTKL